MQIYLINAHGPRAQGDPLINSGNFSRWQCLSSSQNPPRMTPWSGFPRQPMYITSNERVMHQRTLKLSSTNYNGRTTNTARSDGSRRFNSRSLSTNG